jgi:hypothetical protein
MTRVAEKLVWVLLLIVVVDARLRYSLVVAGIPFLIYVKDIMMLGILFHVLLYSAVTCRIGRLLLLFLLLMTFGIVVGIINRLPLLQVMFGVKMLLPFIVSFLVINNLGFRKAVFADLFKIIIPLVLVGLALDMFYDLPWKGLEYEAFEKSIDSSRNRANLGLPRLSGFGRAPHETAAILYAIVALHIGVLVQEGKSRSWWARKYEIVLLVGAFAGVIITTSKSAILAFLILALFYLLIRWYYRHDRWVNLLSGLVLKSTLFALFLYGAIPPIVTFVSPSLITRYLVSDSILIIAVVSSYVDRIERMWPAAFALVSHPYQYLTGRGIGGIGAPQAFFERDLYNPADNLFVYLFIDFGLVLLVPLISYILYKLYISRLAYRPNIYFFCLCIGLFCFGATVNVVESPALTMAFGFMLALWHKEGRDLY